MLVPLSSASKKAMRADPRASAPFLSSSKAPQPQGKKQQQKQPNQPTPLPQRAPKSAPASAAAPASAPIKKKKAAAAAAEVYTSARLDGLTIVEGTDPEISTNGIERDSNATARMFFEWLIFPMSIETFYADYFEKKPLYISRRDIDAKIAQCTLVTLKAASLQSLVPDEGDMPAPAGKVSNKPASVSTSQVKTVENALRTERVTIVPVEAAKKKAPAAAANGSNGEKQHYYSNWFSISDIHSLLRQEELDIQYRQDVDITRYRDGVRETLNPQGRVTEEQMTKFISEACSLRFLCPQKYSAKLWSMLARLDEFFGMQTGANSYYTPKGTQGFAPHFDDVDIFVIQTEGSKRWRLYPPRAPTEILPSISSPNYSQSEIGQPIMDVLLSAGDFLYAPRGTIHQCVASLEEPSLHVTLSTCLQTNWSQYLSILLPRALQLASEERAAFRESLPHGYENFMGVMNSDRPSGGRRERFMDAVLQRLEEMMEFDLLPFDGAADQMVTDFMHGRVPVPNPPAGGALSKRMVDGWKDKPEKQRKSLFKPTTCIRLVRAGVARITTNARGDCVTLHHTQRNSRLYKEQPLAGIEFPIGYAMTLEILLNAYPKYISLGQLPPPDGDDDEDGDVDAAAAEQDLLDLVEQLFDEGLIEVTNDQGSIPTDLRKGDEEDEEEEEDEDIIDEEEEEDEEQQEEEIEEGEDEEEEDGEEQEDEEEDM